MNEKLKPASQPQDVGDVVAEVQEGDTYEHYGRGWRKVARIVPIGPMPAVGTKLYTAPQGAHTEVVAELREALGQIARETEKMSADGCDECYTAACIANGAIARSATT